MEFDQLLSLSVLGYVFIVFDFDLLPKFPYPIILVEQIREADLITGGFQNTVVTIFTFYKLGFAERLIDGSFDPISTRHNCQTF